MAIEIEDIKGLRLCDAEHGVVIDVLQNGEFRIGRAPDNDLAITDPTVSAYHARIYTYLTASYIEDLDSTNGTFVNGKRISKHILKAGDIVRMGSHELLLQGPAQTENEVASLRAG